MSEVKVSALLRMPNGEQPPGHPVPGQLWKKPNGDGSFTYYGWSLDEVWVELKDYNSIPDTSMPLHELDLIRLVADKDRRPMFAGKLTKGRTFLRDFVVYSYNVLAICNSEEMTFEDLPDFQFKEPVHYIVYLENSPDWTVLTHNFKPIDVYNFTNHLIKLRVRNRSDGLRRGLIISPDHPNVLISQPVSPRNQRIIFCADCEESYPTAYEVYNNIWRSVVHESHCFLCLPCLERRLSKKLVIEDFTPNEINTGIRFGYNLAKVEADKEHEGETA